MADIHQQIALRGIDHVRQMAVSKHERLTVETAYQVLADDTERMGFTYSGFALTSLPHKDPKSPTWRRDAPNLTLMMESGREVSGEHIGLPYGSYARFMLLFLQTEAIRTQSREIELGRSMRVWLGSMGLSIGGATYKAVAEQARRISTCKLTFVGFLGGKEIRRNGGFVRDAITISSRCDDQQPNLWQDRVVLDESFYQALRAHPVPVSEAGLRAIGPRSMVLDIYIWLAWRLHALKEPTPVGWPSLQAQFGQDYDRPRRFREHFRTCLEIALAAYPDARTQESREGLMLFPSRPPVTKL